MRIKSRILNTREVGYSSSLNKERLMEKIENLFEQENLNINGKLTGNNVFVAYDKLNVIGWNMPNLKRKSAYLKGEIVQNDRGTLVKLQVKPNSILPVFAILAILVGTIITIIALLNTEYDNYYFIFGLALIAMGVVYYPVSSLLRNRLQNKIIDSLDLKKA